MSYFEKTGDLSPLALSSSPSTLAGVSNVFAALSTITPGAYSFLRLRVFSIAPTRRMAWE